MHKTEIKENDLTYLGYVSSIRKWDWAFLKYRISEQPALPLQFPVYDESFKTLFIGTIASFYPSGKRLSQTLEIRSESELEKDNTFHAALESVAESHGMTAVIGDDPNDVFLEVCLPKYCP